MGGMCRDPAIDNAGLWTVEGGLENGEVGQIDIPVPVDPAQAATTRWQRARPGHAVRERVEVREVHATIDVHVAKETR